MFGIISSSSNRYSSSSASSDSTSAGASSTGPSGGSTFTSSTETHPSASGARHRPGHGTSASTSDTKPSSSKSTNEPKKRDYTPEQAAVVKRIRSCKVTEYYEIMSLKRDCEEVEVKKAYRKVCISYSLLVLCSNLSKSRYGEI